MRKQILTLGFLAILLLWPFSTALASTPKADLKKQVMKAAPGLHLPFVENKGQVTDPNVAYVADTFACRVSVTKDGQIAYGLPGDKKSKTPGVEIKERLIGDSVKIQVGGRKKHGAKVSYYPSRDKSQWRSNVPTYEQVSLGQVAPGIEMALSARSQNVEKLFFVEPGADPTNIQLNVEGAEKLSVKANGELELATASGVMRFSKPIAYQEIDGKRRMVKVGYQVKEYTYTFALGNYDLSQKLVIDPLITVFPVVQGNGDHNIIEALATDAEGNIYAAGAAASELAIFKFDSGLENILASTYFSENADYMHDMIFGMDIDSSGNVIVAGRTQNLDLPVTDGCHDNQFGDNNFFEEGFITKFSADLGTMLASTFIGGDYCDGITAMVVDANDQVYVAGFSEQAPDQRQSFPVTDGAFDESPTGYYCYKGVVAKLDSNLSTVLAATYLGGHNCDKTECDDRIQSLTIDGKGDIWVAGHTTYPDFPVTDGCLDDSYDGDGDIFLSKLDPDLSQLLISTYIGGIREEAPTDIKLDDQGNIYLLGWTYSSAFPMPDGGYMSEHSQYEEDGFILKLNPSADEILSGTFIGGAYDGEGWGDEAPAAMVFSADGSKLHVVGRTESATFPTTSDCYADVVEAGINRDTNFYFEGLHGRDHDDRNWGDGFLATFSADLDQLLYSSFLGGQACDYLDDVLINGNDIIIAGETKSKQFPMIEIDESQNRGVLMRFSDTATGPTDPDTTDTPDSTENSGDGGGGGGGCFISTSATFSR